MSPRWSLESSAAISQASDWPDHRSKYLISLLANLHVFLARCEHLNNCLIAILSTPLAIPAHASLRKPVHSLSGCGGLGQGCRLHTNCAQFCSLTGSLCMRFWWNAHWYLDNGDKRAIWQLKRDTSENSHMFILLFYRIIYKLPTNLYGIFLS